VVREHRRPYYTKLDGLYDKLNKIDREDTAARSAIFQAIRDLANRYGGEPIINPEHPEWGEWVTPRTTSS